MHASRASDGSSPGLPFFLAGWAAFLRIATVWLVGPNERRHSVEVQIGLTKLLYSHISNILMVGFAGLLSGIYAYVRDNETAFFFMALAGFLLVLVRCGMVKLFQSRLAKGCSIEPERWIVGYGLTACASSGCWGALCFSCLAFSHDPVLYLVSVVFTTATAGSVAARNAPVPRIARIQLVLSLLPVIAGAPLADDSGYLFLDLAVPAFIFGLFALITEINKNLVELYTSQTSLRNLSNTDHLTQIANRRYFGECFSETLAVRRTSLRPVAILMIDVDWFKGYNDHYGHPAGDRCLQEIAQRLQFSLRSYDSLVSRYGGEEFAVMLRDTDSLVAMTVAQRLCDSLAEAALPHGNRKDDVEFVTISVGVAATDRLDVGYNDLITCADQALYLAKTLGRNRVCVAGRCDALGAITDGRSSSEHEKGPGGLCRGLSV